MTNETNIRQQIFRCKEILQELKEKSNNLKISFDPFEPSKEINALPRDVDIYCEIIGNLNVSSTEGEGYQILFSAGFEHLFSKITEGNSKYWYNPWNTYLMSDENINEDTLVFNNRLKDIFIFSCNDKGSEYWCVNASADAPCFFDGNNENDFLKVFTNFVQELKDYA